MCKRRRNFYFWSRKERKKKEEENAAVRIPTEYFLRDRKLNYPDRREHSIVREYFVPSPAFLTRGRRMASRSVLRRLAEWMTHRESDACFLAAD